MSTSVELNEIKKKLETLESMIRLLLERGIPEDEPLPDEIEAIESEDELISLEEARKSLED
ncbi:MAG: hypothetical protein DRN78_03620 [Thermoproteota archaeon]|nr:MAG: hypothetical protein DRN78_03620 [Candidatus Korarchaeota archaeon]